MSMSAYASPTGTNGCDEGGLKHRANQLKFVMAMDRCGSCAFATRTANGTPVCQKYNKELIAELPEGSAEYQQESIRMADASDAEMTASLFLVTTLRVQPANSEMDNFAFDEMANTETIADVFSVEWRLTMTNKQAAAPANPVLIGQTLHDVLCTLRTMYVHYQNLH